MKEISQQPEELPCLSQYCKQANEHMHTITDLHPSKPFLNLPQLRLMYSTILEELSLSVKFDLFHLTFH